MDTTFLIEDYFQYLMDQTHTYYGREQLLRYLFSREFYSSIERDNDRVSYGLSLRREYLLTYGLQDGLLDELGPVTVLEVLIAFAQQYDRHTMRRDADDDRSSLWFWMMLDNLGLYDIRFTDSMWNDSSAEECRRIVNIFLDRGYDQNCHGGLFPVEHVDMDMRELTLWGQINYYFREKKLWNSFRAD